MAEHMFLRGKKHLPVRAATIALRHGATLINHIDPVTLERSHWFESEARTPQAREQLEQNVTGDLLANGIKVNRAR